ncbi:MAG: 4'-phosphopantetheinyl transferase [Rickettsiales bacterium]|jgi:4'-phosphopantetheinyl transferase
MKAKRNFICGRVLIKTTLAKMLSCEAGDVVLKSTANGRLEIDYPKSDLNFNISHSVNFITLAFSNKAVGIDIEQNKDRNFLDIAEYFFSKNEFESIKNLDSNEEKKRLFYYYWTIKESFVKCSGANLESGEFCLKKFPKKLILALDSARKDV